MLIVWFLIWTPYLSTSALLGKICSNDEVPLTRKDNTGGDLFVDNMVMILAGNDIVMSPVTLTIQLQIREKNR